MGDSSILAGVDLLTSNLFNTETAQHYFCSRCGVHAHHQRRWNQQQYRVNVACLDGISPFDFEKVPVKVGVHHPNDTGRSARLAGTPRFVPAKYEGAKAIWSPS
jgi:hypothetical protein